MAAIAALAVVGAGTIEVLLRLAGRAPGRPPQRSTAEPGMHDPDPEIGWVPRPGRYTYPGYAPGSAPITVTFWRDGARATRAEDDPRGERLVLVGDSVVT